MKTISNYINEKLKIGKSTKQYIYFPKNTGELRTILRERLLEDKDSNLTDIDVSKIRDMARLFEGLDPHNIDISLWDVSKVEDMYSMFYGCENFNCDLSDWDVSKVEDMGWMFWECKNLDCDLSNWNVTNMIRMDDMFGRCTSMKNKPSWYKEI